MARTDSEPFALFRCSRRVINYLCNPSDDQDDVEIYRFAIFLSVRAPSWGQKDTERPREIEKERKKSESERNAGVKDDPVPIICHPVVLVARFLPVL